MNEITVVVIGHLAVGLLFGVKELSDKKKVKSDIEKFISENPDRKEFAETFINNKPLVLTTFSLVGYFNFYYVIRKIFKKLSK